MAAALLELKMEDPMDTLMQDSSPAYVRDAVSEACMWYDEWVCRVHASSSSELRSRGEHERAPTGQSSAPLSAAIDSLGHVPFPPVYLLQQYALRESQLQLQLQSSAGVAAAKAAATSPAGDSALAPVLDLLAYARLHPKIAALDPFTKILYLRLVEASDEIQKVRLRTHGLTPPPRPPR